MIQGDLDVPKGVVCTDMTGYILRIDMGICRNNLVLLQITTPFWPYQFCMLRDPWSLVHPCHSSPRFGVRRRVRISFQHGWDLHGLSPVMKSHWISIGVQLLIESLVKLSFGTYCLS